MIHSDYCYPVDLNIEYSNDFEYRKSLRRLFQMNSSNYPSIVESDIDNITRDEQEYDEQSAAMAMECVIHKTRDNPLFYALYEQSATFMFSTNIDIGLAVLFSYDYLLLFHRCLSDYFKSLTDNKTPFTIENENYKALYNKLFTKR
jgi:hypothetical protein